MPRQPKPNLASIVASADPSRRIGVGPAARGLRPAKAEVVRFDSGGSAPVPAREGTLKERARQMSVYLEPPVYDQLRDLAHAERTKMHGLMLEALDLLFKQRGARSIEQVLGESAR